ncbi:glycoside hydrolase family 16 protein [Sphingobacterium pedocola]|nr:glycoside hydrolase family 16 protein [Sphingobacterium pedocola]
MNLPKILVLIILNTLLLVHPNFAYAQGPIPVEIVKTATGYELLRGGKPYFIKGAGGSNYMDKLKNYGGNSIRTWSTNDAQRILDEAHRLGLTVTMGLAVATERHGFDYNDKAAIAKQLDRLRKEIQQFKDHPALLAWGIGNELNLHYSNPKVWDAVEEIASMIQELDPNHLVTTMLAGINQKEVDLIKAKCPSLDLIAVQVYGGLASVPEQIRSTGWDKAYIVTEWGPTGHWEGPQTPWHASIEETSKEKAAVYKSRYEASIGLDKSCLGSYVFLWGQKQERTPTWYGLFTEAGEENEVVDVMHYLWKGKWPKNRAPRLDSLLLNGKKALDFVYLKPAQRYDVAVFVTDPDKDKLSVRWEILHESTDLKEGGDRESRPRAIDGLLTAESLEKALLVAPEQEGAYRLFVYVTDGYNHVATANIPFFVSVTEKPSHKALQPAHAHKSYQFSEKVSWSDEFDYNGLPDSTKWSYDVGSKHNGWGNNELQYYTEADLKNVSVNNSTLKITALKEKKQGMDYTSARLISKHKGDFLYGRFEARAKVPRGRGTWPAIWMLPTEWKYGGWPNSGEIDILEHVGYDQDVVHISVHTKAYHHSIHTQKTATKKIDAASDDFHLYRIDWTPDYIKGFVDDIEIFHFSNENKTYEEWPFDQKFHWLLNLAVGGFWGGQKGIDDSAFPAVMEIDYVRVYDLADLD